jgi:hypothetical protein
MIFKTDKQTVDDLALFGNRRGKSVYNIFNKTATAGGAGVLEQMFLYPLSNRLEIERRLSTIAFFMEHRVEFPFGGALLDAIEFYLSNKDERSRISAHEDNLERKFRTMIGSDSDYEQIKRGVLGCVKFICGLRGFVKELVAMDFEGKSGFGLGVLCSCVTDPDFEDVYGVEGARKLTFEQTVRLDQLLRFSCRGKLEVLLAEVYKLDVFIAVAAVSRERGFCFARPAGDGGAGGVGAGVGAVAGGAVAGDAVAGSVAGSVAGDDIMLDIVGGFHPLVEGAVPNSVRVGSKNNMIFLTGANMAGKSTFMKMVGIAVYLAHMGFPVPAASMSFRVLNGMFTTINLADNINAGYSHFYAEVMRVKRVSEKVGQEGNMLVIFDELFRGTNVKDACDATIAVAEALAGLKNSVFMISSHIIEAGEALGSLRDNVEFLNLPTKMKGRVPEYTYRIERGISQDRHGMLIIKNEGIPQLLGYKFE